MHLAADGQIGVKQLQIGQKNREIVDLDCWQNEEIEMYGIRKDVRFLVLDLIWKPEFSKLRFVHVKYDDIRTILVTTDLTLNGAEVIKLSCVREKIECTFRELNQVVNAYSSRFWMNIIIYIY